MKHKEWIDAAFEEAYKGMRNNAGGPFGAVVVLNNQIVGRGHNQVTSTHDPTAHAEMVALRDACRKLKQFHLVDADIYTTSEPCPMCLAALYWANIKKIYYSTDKHQVAEIGFSDQFIYEQFKLPEEERLIPIEQIDLEKGKALFEEWRNKEDKTPY
ncbi:MAG TPA: nucleoside deaminase [Bacteroidales bacterium]|nr:nucleoside deaminase [Bacteroidales bacterium]HOH23034.1 nucleoside deaminase [Bacteroidales bacterium]HPZ03728.1 nucleoside deaminase [Bacteroidales bacterium]HQB75285.1 nucleoside deaminase [Bacteroidales bacterium]